MRERLDAGTPQSEVAILIRQQPHLLVSTLSDALTARGIPFRNEQKEQDLAAEPAAALLFNFIRVVADDRQSAAYGERFDGHRGRWNTARTAQRTYLAYALDE